MYEETPPRQKPNDAASRATRPPAEFYIPNARAFRVHAGKTIAELCGAAHVNPSTVRKIEKLIPVTLVYANRLFLVLQEWNKTRFALDPNREITKINKKIPFPSPIAVRQDD